MDFTIAGEAETLSDLTIHINWVAWGTPRKLRIEYPAAIYHGMNLGDRREDIFKSDDDRERFPAALQTEKELSA